MSRIRIFIGLGSNMGDRVATLRSAVMRIDNGAIADTVLTNCSHLVETRPMGPAKYPFLNAVIEVAASVDPSIVLAGCLALEREHGRVRTAHWGPRALDLDLLFGITDAGPIFQKTPQLRLPHPGLQQRDFVLAPLAELAPDLRIGDKTSLEWLAALPDTQRTILRKHPEHLLPRARFSGRFSRTKRGDQRASTPSPGG
ncbi:MAG: 2-amino-4-hydroxy-6-hydroxymethyldihydropteridine diphosphokinase [Nannocystaceae bacterium]